MINRASYLIFSCRLNTAVGQLCVAAWKTPNLSLHSIGKGNKRPSTEHHYSGFVIDNALTRRHLDQTAQSNPHRPRNHIANRHRLRGFLP